MESEKVFLGAMVCRKLSPMVSNYRSQSELSEWLAERDVMGISDLDTRAITKRVRETGCLVGVITTDPSKVRDRRERAPPHCSRSSSCAAAGAAAAVAAAAAAHPPALTVPGLTRAPSRLPPVSHHSTAPAKTDEELVQQAKEWSIEGKDLISDVTTKEVYTWKDPTLPEWEFSRSEAVRGEKDTLKLVTYDFGIKHNIMRRFASFGCEITVVPASTPAADVLAMEPDGVFLSNGPGDPSAVPYAVENTKEIVGKVPLFGICMGHQVLGQAVGSKTFKLPFGHHGGNHPVRHNATGRVDICAHNHNYAVDPDALPEGMEVTHVNLNDGTVSGMQWKEKMAMSIQYHPESSPGPHDADVEFETFVQLMKDHKASK